MEATNTQMLRSELASSTEFGEWIRLWQKIHHKT